MGGRRRPAGGGRPFGGPWTEERLKALEAYLRAYTTALKRQSFERVYVDAFAGPGWARQPPTELLGDLDPEDTGYREGSPRRALHLGGFDQYVFIDKSRAAVEALDRLQTDFPASATQIQVIQGDANVEVPKLCSGFDWKRTRGVIYFDPFGLELAWDTLEAVARTKLDVWLLFPIGAANRMMTRSGEIDEKWQEALDRLLGGPEWRQNMYRHEGEQLGWNGTIDPLRRKAPWPRLLQHVKLRLGQLFAGRVAEPVIQLNSRQAPLYAVFFAVANPDRRAWDLAHGIAQHILGKLRHPEEVTW